jgi:hypothetical protein
MQLMMGSYLLLIPFLIQAVCIFVDEFYFHVKRGLPKWERIGHPIDTLSVLVCFLFIVNFPCSALNVKIYGLLCALSMILITKDEFIHKEVCPKLEMWLHAVLFINHPLLLLAAGCIWGCDTFAFLNTLSSIKDLAASFFWGQTLFTGLFMLYQIIYWNFIWKPQKV